MKYVGNCGVHGLHPDCDVSRNLQHPVVPFGEIVSSGNDCRQRMEASEPLRKRIISIAGAAAPTIVPKKLNVLAMKNT